METVKHHKTIVVSDIHLGSKWSKAKEVTRFLKQNTCDTLILCGDIIDAWNLMRGKKNKWKKRHTNFIKLILDLQHDTKIIYLRGNHDDFLAKVLPIAFQNISIVEDYVHVSGDKRFYVLHGDVFDSVTSRFSWLAKVGDVGYTFLLWVNRYYNNRRLKKGLPYYSLSKEIKQKVKASVSYISDFEQHISKIAKKKKCDGVICGHIHHPEKRYIDDILYLNSGDWVESLSALTEDYEGNWNIVYYEQAENRDDSDKEIDNSVAEYTTLPQLKLA
ncbi:MAG: UDP-2,3-diacylglucosamine diphosphatase [Dysgonomonas sp.]